VTGSLEAEIRDFAGDPRETDTGFESGADLGRKFGDGKDAAFGRRRLGGLSKIPLAL
jgi:hypothetical protein